MKKTLTFILLIPAFCVFSQPLIEWQENIGNVGYYAAGGFQETTDGGFIIAGTTSAFGNNGDCWVVKMNADRTIVWQKTFGGSESDGSGFVQQTSDGGYIIGAGTSSNDGDVSNHHGGGDMWILKLDSTGSIQWQRVLGGDVDDQLTAIQQTSDGGYIACGKTASNDADISGNHGLSDVWLVKLDSSGNTEWSRCLGGSDNEYEADVQPTADGGYILATYSDSSDGDLDNNLGYLDGWVVKLDADGAIEWQKNFGGFRNDVLRFIRQTADGGYVAGGHSNSFPSDISGNDGRVDCWLIKISASGTLEWQRTFGGTHDEIITGLDLTEDGGFVFAALTYSNNGDVLVNYGQYDCWIVRLNDIGHLVWQTSLGGSSPDRANAVLETTDGGICFTASIHSIDGHFPVAFPEGSNAWIVKLNGTSDTGDPLPLSPPSMTLFPNPTSGFLHVELPEGARPVTAALIDVSGKILRPVTLDSSGNMDLSDLPSGVYLLTVTDQNGVGYSGKVIRE